MVIIYLKYCLTLLSVLQQRQQRPLRHLFHSHLQYLLSEPCGYYNLSSDGRSSETAKAHRG
eukprot:TRINITY_DN5817_c0_g1_i1.p2 TRINITY_DN5817_c0_g1~~TRINITY_DN5817_c0_g1_i1.p2  ORF type:complete len:61 (-),score=12.58 TRINITY_DN5817_c0_g1_i1:2-184(-)